MDTTGRRRAVGDSVPLPPPAGSPPTPPATQPRPAAGDTTQRPPVRDTTVRVAPRDTAGRDTLPRLRRDSTPNPFGDIDLRFQGRLETKLLQTRNDRCARGVAALAFTCRASWVNDLAGQFSMKATGPIADVVHVDVDYDSQREFEASNTLSLSYTARRADAKLGRLELGNVSFAPPPSRFITAGIPSNNVGLQAMGQLGTMRWRAIAAQQRGDVVRDRVFTVGGGRASQQMERTIEDWQIEPRRFFWTIDPRLLPGYPGVDVLDRAGLARLARALPDTLRPARLVVYRQLIGAAYQNPRGPRLLVRGAKNRVRQTYEVLREGIDYYADPSLLWIALVRPLGLSNERLAVAYEVNLGGRRVRYVNTGGTPDLELTTEDQFANLVWEPELAPGDSAFAREMRNVYRVGGEDLRRETLNVRLVAGIGDQEKPQDPSSGATYLQLFGLAERTNPSTFDVANRLWPRPQDPNVGVGGGTLGGRLLRDQFVVFPSQQPFARAGGVRNTANPSNDTLYTFPSEFLYSAQRPRAIYRLRLRYESEGATEAATIALGSLQLRPGSERLTALGRTLVRGVDYAIDYELGTVTFLDPGALFPTPTDVTVRFEENPVFVQQPTTVFGAAAEFPTSAGTVFLTAISQSRKSSTLTRPTLGFEATGSTVAGIGADLSWDAPPLARLAARLTGWSRRRAPGDTSPMPGARISFHGELAASKPHARSTQQAFLETFEGGEGFPLPVDEASWYYSSRPPSGASLVRALGTPLTVTRAATMAWQGNVTPRDSAGAFSYRITQIDPAIQLSGGSGIEPAVPAMWLTLYPLSVGGLPSSSGTPPFRWTVGNAPSGRRWRSIRTVINAGGADLSRVEDLEFYALVNDPSRPEGRRNPTLVFDFGEISENSVAFQPETLFVAGRDSTYRGRRLAGFDTLDTERDSLSRVFNATTNDVGLPGDRARNVVVVDGGTVRRADTLAVCHAVINGIRVLGDPTTDCTVQNARLDEEDIDQDGTLNLRDAQSDQERIRRFVIDLADARLVSAGTMRVTNCNVAFPAGLGTLLPGAATQAGARKCWVQIRVPFRAPTDSLGAFNARRVRAARLTVVSGAEESDSAATTVALARLRLSGAPWLRRTDRVATGVGGDSTGTPSSFVVAGVVGTQDSTARLPYTPPPGTAQTTETVTTGTEAQRVPVNERSLRLQAGVPGGEIARYERAEAYLRFPEGAKNVMSYRQLRVWARGHGHGWGPDGDLQFFVRLGRDEHNFYLYRTPVNAGSDASAWLPEVRVDFERLHALRVALQEQLLPGRLNAPSRFPCTGVDSALVARSGLPRGLPVRRVAACDGGYMVYSVDGNVTPPNLAAVQELAVGFVRVDDARRGASAIAPNDTLELWVDDVRLADAEDAAGMAGEVGVGVHFGDLADVRVNFTRRDPQFRQLGEMPTFVATGGLEIGASVRLDRLLPWSLGLALPLTVTRTSIGAAPMFIAGTDLRGDALTDLRAPREATTSWALTVRRATPAKGPLAPILNNLSLTSTYVAGQVRSSYEDGARHAFSLRADYDVAPGERVTLGGVRWTPTAFRLTSHRARTGDRQEAFLAPVRSPLDSGRVVTGLDDVWEHGATLELHPLPSLTARWDASTLRDLRDYATAPGSPDDTLPRAELTRAERTHLGGLDLGFERQRVLTGALSWTPAVRPWLRPRADVTTTYTMTRDPNAPSLVGPFGDIAPIDVVQPTNVATLPRRVGATQQLSAATSVDLARALYGPRAGTDSASRARAPWLARLFVQPVNVSASRTLSASYDATSADPGLGVQLGLAGIGGMRAIDGTPATLAGVVDQLDATQTLTLPFGFALTNHLGTGATRSWWRRAATGALAEGTGDRRVVPDLTLRWTWRPAPGASALVSNVSATARVLRDWRTAVAPADSTSPEDARAMLSQSWPLSATVTWAALGGLTTGAGFTQTRRIDDLPGTRLTSREREANAEIARAFRPPARWGLKSDIRTRIGWQDRHAVTVVSGADPAPGEPTTIDLLAPFVRTTQADLGQRLLSFGANSDVADNVTLSLTGSRTTRFNRNFGTQFTETLLSASLQLGFFSGAFH
ncbi:Cell surface SprA [Gemmatirosa kalamazoonensis]|uniref:Cell surface SprA n=1 Tax=Gemmatirosa kalamazoonensis TaxID=861299 RepID=W0RQB8_9BACT|nr:cell surface protein SprA [Gemmatirosa kalamazoonensis]AHG91698.1 Cell surface SprA [Gemmatirosa kalamazoonensis]